MCWDSKTEGEFILYINLQSYPPIGALINMETNSKMFKLNLLKFKVLGTFCIAKGNLRLNNSVHVPASTSRTQAPDGVWRLAPAVQHSLHKKSVNPIIPMLVKQFHYISKKNLKWF
jgi:hypothetical protein